MRGFYTTHEAAQLLGVSLPTVVNWIKARRLKAHRTPGGHRRIAREELAVFMVRQGMPLPEELAGAAPARPKALVLGEHGPMREGLARQLAQAGYAVEQASDGFAAGAAAARFQPDLVVLSAGSADGGEVLSGLRADRELGEVPVVAVGRADWASGLTEAGCNAVVARPLTEGALVKAASDVLALAGASRARS
jgi:excisionase family DNA binding protein